MRVVLQRVQSAKVSVAGEICGRIERGLVMLLGVEQEENSADIDWLVRKTVQLRVFEDEGGKMNRSLLDIHGDVLLISQFTLLGSLKKGSRPSFHRAGPPEFSERVYRQVADGLARALGKEVALGRFGEFMEIEMSCQGPVTLIIDTKERNF